MDAADLHQAVQEDLQRRQGLIAEELIAVAAGSAMPAAARTR